MNSLPPHTYFMDTMGISQLLYKKHLPSYIAILKENDKKGEKRKENASLDELYTKILSCINQNLRFLFLHVIADDYFSCLILKIISYKLRKHGVFTVL